MNRPRKSNQPTEPRRTAAISTGQFVSGSLFRLVREIRGSAYSVGDQFMLLDEADCHDPNILKLGGTGETYFTDPAGKPLKIEAGDKQIDSIFELVQDPQQILESATTPKPSTKPVTESDLQRLSEEIRQSIQEVRDRPPVPGPKGERGEPGGVKGPKGDRGSAGAPGKAGRMGERGPRGLRGERGPQGKAGIPGKRGPEGKPGPKGPKGERGERGQRGEKGDSGILSAKFPLVYDSKEKSVGIDEARLDAILKRILSGKSVSPADMGWFASTGGGGKVAILWNGQAITPDVRSLNFKGSAVESVTKRGGTITVNISAPPQGVTQVSAGAGISVSGATGSVTITNTGVREIVAGNNISISSSTGSVTISSAVDGIGSKFFYQSASPSGATIGDRWMDSENGQEYVYVNDGNTNQWVQPSIPNTISATVNTVVGIEQSSYFATQLDYYIGISYAGKVTVTLPDAPEEGREIIVKDESGNAGKGPNRAITIVGSDSSTIDNRASAVINIDNAALHLIYRNGWRIV